MSKMRIADHETERFCWFLFSERGTEWDVWMIDKRSEWNGVDYWMPFIEWIHSYLGDTMRLCCPCDLCG